VPERLELAVGLDAPARARRWIAGICETWDLDHLSDAATLMVGELVTNAVLHTGTECVVVAEHGDDALRVQVIDGGRDWADVEAAPAERLNAGGGRGLVIVAALATDWGVQEHTQGKSVWFTLPSDRSGRAAPTVLSTSRIERA